jgi:enamine deaminase RidA (YjgF/YER057c/UK114 family)
MEIVQPSGWAAPRGYANGVVAEGRLLFVAGQIGWDPETGQFASDGFFAQTRTALRNVVAVVEAAGGEATDIARLTWFVVDRDAYLNAQREIGAVYREVFGRHFPTMSVVVVAGLLEERAKVEIEATAVIAR